MKIYKLIIFAALCLPLDGIAGNMQWDNFLNSEGVTSMADADSVLWLGTTGGLVKFNKATHLSTFYNRANSDIPFNSGLHSLCLDTAGHIVIGFSDGTVSRFDGSSWNSVNLPGISDIRQIFCDRSGNLWICCGTSIGSPNFIYNAIGVSKYNGVTLTNYYTGNSGLVNNNVTSIAQAPNGDMWFATFNGIDRFTGTNWINYNPYISPLPYRNVMDLFFTPDGDMVMNSWHISAQNIFDYSALSVVDSGTWSWTNVSFDTVPSLGHSLASSVSRDGSGTIWFATDTVNGTIGDFPTGLGSFDGSSVQRFVNANSGLKSSDVTYTISGDSVTWLGTGSGLERKSGSSWDSYYISNIAGVDVNSFRVNCMARDSAGRLAAATDKGILFYNDTTWSVLDTSNSGLPNPDVSAVAFDRNGDLWAASDSPWPSQSTYRHCILSHISGNTWTHYDSGDCPALAVRTAEIQFDTANKLYILTGVSYGSFNSMQANIATFDGTAWTVDSGIRTACNNFVIGPNGHIWIAGTDTLSEFDGVQWFPHLTGMNFQNAFSCMKRDRNGSFWLGNSHPAYPDLYQFDGTNWTTHATNPGFGNVNLIACDDYGNIWGEQNRTAFRYRNSVMEYFNYGSSMAYDDALNILAAGPTVWYGHANGFTRIRNEDDAVWPGDCNHDGSVDMTDALYLGLALGDTGSVRPNASMAWMAQDCPDWAGQFLSGANHKHADCDGNGVVQFADTMAILTNYSMQHLLRPATPSATAPSFTITATNHLAHPGDTIRFNLSVAGTAAPLDSLYGIAFSLNYDASLVDSGSTALDIPASSLGAPSDLFALKKNAAQPGTVSAAVCRFDHQNALLVSGTLATFTAVIPSSSTGGTLTVSASDVNGITAGEQPITFQVSSDSVVIQILPSGLNPLLPGAFSVYPNPAPEQFLIRSDLPITRITLFDSMGSAVFAARPAEREYRVPTVSLPAGIYCLRAESGSTMRNIMIEITR